MSDRERLDALEKEIRELRKAHNALAVENARLWARVRGRQRANRYDPASWPRPT